MEKPRRYKKREESSSSSSSSSSSESDSSSSSDDRRRSSKKLEARRLSIKKKLRESKKIKKMLSPKSRERHEREKKRHHHRSGSKARKSPSHHRHISEKIIIRREVRDSRERERRDRRSRERERAEALARCQERQRERDRIAREKHHRREKDDRIRIPRPVSRGRFDSRDRSIDRIRSSYDRELVEHREYVRRHASPSSELYRERDRDLYPSEDYHMRNWQEPGEIPREYDREKVYHDDWHSRKPLKDSADWDADDHRSNPPSRRWAHGSGGSRYKQALLPTPSDYGGSSRSGYRHHQSSSSSSQNYRAPFPSKRSMTYTNPNILKNRAAAKASEAAKAAEAAATQTVEKSSDTPKPPEPASEKEEGQIDEKQATPTQADEDNLSEISDADDDILAEEDKEVKSIEAGEITGDIDSSADLDKVLEEISDNEIEEDKSSKGIGDALGVDWASLVEASKAKAIKTSEEENEKKKNEDIEEKWQTNRILLDIGISVKYAGEKLAKELTQGADIHPLACMQVGKKNKDEVIKSLVFNACGSNTRALSARQDLLLRRKLCNMPTKEFEPRAKGASDSMKAMAAKMFQKAIASSG